MAKFELDLFNYQVTDLPNCQGERRMPASKRGHTPKTCAIAHVSCVTIEGSPYSFARASAGVVYVRTEWKYRVASEDWAG